MRLENMTSSRGNKIANQFIIHASEGKYFQSYNTMIAFKDRLGKVQLDHDHEHSRTTMKYLGLFLGHNIAETRKRIAAGDYIVTDLNKD